jgi:PKD repeat protein
MITNTGVDAMMSFSNYGTCVDMFAPGYQVISDWNNGSVWLLTGTSPSAPLAAGAAADYLEAHPSASPAEVGSALQSSATTGVLSGLGSGSPNRLLYVGGGSAPPPPPPDTTTVPASNAAPTASFTATCQKASCSFNASGSKDDNGIVRYDWTFGDGATATSSSPTALHVYAAKGTYSMTVTLTVTDGGGLSNQISKKISIKNSGK